MSPFLTLFPPQPRVFSQLFDFVAPLFSYSYESLSPPQVLSFHIHPNPRGVCTPPAFPTLRPSGLRKRQLFCLQAVAASFTSLCALLRTLFLCFQSLAASFAKTPGWGEGRQQSPIKPTGGIPGRLKPARSARHGSPRRCATQGRPRYIRCGAARSAAQRRTPEAAQ